MNSQQFTRFCGFATIGLLAGACSTSAQQARTPAPNEVVVTVGSTNITLAQLDEKALQEPAATFGSMKLSQALYEARRATADEMAGNLLLDQEAKRRGVDRTKLYDDEITAHAGAVTEAEVAGWYQGNQQRVQGATLEQVRAPIRQLLTQERLQAAKETYLTSLKTKTPVRVMLEPPRVAVSAANGPVKGSASAPIEVIEFADFQCPFCQAASPTVKRVLDTYGDRIRLAYRHYPLPNHQNARPAAEAAHCAHEQGQFWAYHDKLFGDPNKLTVAELKQTAAAMGMDAPRFNKCVDDHKYASVVEADMKAGVDAGVSGTPAFFINGRLLSGAQPFEAVKRVIDEELQLKNDKK
jgi:protein-disulfide isomerase